MYSCWIYPDVLMLDISGCTRVGYIQMYSCWIYPDVLVLDISGCTRSCRIYPDVLVLDISGCTHVGYILMYSIYNTYMYSIILYSVHQRPHSVCIIYFLL